MRQPTPRLIAGIAGAVLVLAGAALAITVLRGPDLGSSATGQTVSESRQPPGATDGGSSQPPSGSTGLGGDGDATEAPPVPVPIPPATESEPFWRTRQREAEARLLGDEGGAGAPGAIAVISFDPAREAAMATPATTPPTDASPSVVTGPTTRAVSQGGATLLAGVWAGTAEELARYLLRTEPAPRFSVPTETLASYYVRYAREVGLRADVLWAQMLHETGFGAYGGSVNAGQNNYAGIGATGGGVPGITFATAEAGVMAHVAHMVAYVFMDNRAPWVNSITDPRYDMVAPRGAARVLSDLDGRWAVPGNGYGAAIERHVRAINGA